MEKLIEILKEFDIDNIGALIGVSIILISVATCLLYTSPSPRDS